MKSYIMIKKFVSGLFHTANNFDIQPFCCVYLVLSFLLLSNIPTNTVDYHIVLLAFLAQNIVRSQQKLRNVGVNGFWKKLI